MVSLGRVLLCGDKCLSNPNAGASKHHLELEGPDATVGDLKALIEGITEVPSDAQKIIFKGKHRPWSVHGLHVEISSGVLFCGGKSVAGERGGL